MSGYPRAEEAKRLFLECKKRCASCKEIKDRDDFNSSKRSWDGRGAYCKPCSLAKGNEHARRTKLGWTQTEYDEANKNQDGKCFICKKPDPASGLHADHCHRTGATRKLLCRNCNAGLGFFQDDPTLLRLAAAYLEV